ncbi:hypothetical protein [Nostoc sp.]|uniref:hypothetical protein n=1 Tax=Nostoc sp. TaxID=1180 RepID=UPI003FA52C45
METNYNRNRYNQTPPALQSHRPERGWKPNLSIDEQKTLSRIVFTITSPRKGMETAHNNRDWRSVRALRSHHPERG